MFNNGKHDENRVSSGKAFAAQSGRVVESAPVMWRKDERIGLRVAARIKEELQRVAENEGRSLAQICDVFLRAGLQAYKREGSKYVQSLLANNKRVGKASK